MPGRHGTAATGESLKRARSGHPASHAHLALAPIVTLLCLVSLCVLVTGCGARPVTATPRRTPYITPYRTPFATSTPTTPPITTPAVKAPLSWHISTLPTGETLYFPVSTLTVAPSNGDVAYLCDGDGSRSTRFFLTRDHGASWRRMTDLPTRTSCTYPVIDAADANTVLLGGAQAMLLTTDGGATWQQRAVASQSSGIIAFATWHSLHYAIIGEMLAVSTDDMRSWHYTDPHLSAPDLTFSGVNTFQLWVNPASGAVLANIRGRMWDTQDSGQHWSPLTGQQFPGDWVVVQPPQAGQPWHICLEFFSSDGEVPFTCTGDGGRTWRDQPAPVAYADPLAIDTDGSLLVHDSTAIYRLPPGTKQWRALGRIPSLCDGSIGFATFVPSASGSWWAFPAGGKGACNEFATAPANRS